MKTISATNLRVQLRDLLADLDTGPVTITKHGKVVAVLSAPDEPVEAIEVTSTTEDTAEAPDASQSAPEPTAPTMGSIPVSVDVLEEIYNSSREDEEETDELDGFEQRIEEIDADFEAYLSKQMPMDRPLP